MVRIVFSDFDNTMMNYYSDKNYFDNYQISVLKKVCNSGIKFCIVTGRSVSFFEQFPNLLEVIDYIIGSNGACVYDVKNKKFIFQQVIDNEILNQLLDYSIKNNHSFLLNCLDKRYQYGEWNRVKGEKYIKDGEYNCEQIVVSFDEKYKEDIIMFLEYLSHIIVSNVTNWGNKYSIDINDDKVSKGNSVKWLCKKLNIDKKDSIAFGDGENDISMFQVVGKSVSMENASDSIKKLTDDVALNYKQYGIYKYIENNILK